jgi:hypothetical protein
LTPGDTDTMVSHFRDNDTYFILGIEGTVWKLYGTADNIGSAVTTAKEIAATSYIKKVLIAQVTHQTEVKLVRDVVVLPARSQKTSTGRT